MSNESFLHSAEMRSVIETAKRAVRIASAVAVDVQSRLVPSQSVVKTDSSPVTVADFSAQAIVSNLIHREFEKQTGKPFRLIAEEDSKTLKEGGDALVSEVLKAVQGASEGMAIEIATPADLFTAIDAGVFEYDTASGVPSHYFILDPIDGTKGFLRRGQYAVGLAYAIEGKPVAAVVGCPNLPYDKDGTTRGVLFSAIEGGGAWKQKLFEDSEPERIHVSEVADPSKAVFCESLDPGHSDHDTHMRVAADLGITSESIRMDSMCKYGMVASGSATIFLRFPKKGYVEKVWDHAPGQVLITEAGGRITDALGRSLDFSKGTFISNSAGIIASNGKYHDEILAAVARTHALE